MGLRALAYCTRLDLRGGGWPVGVSCDLLLGQGSGIVGEFFRHDPCGILKADLP